MSESRIKNIQIAKEIAYKHICGRYVSEFEMRKVYSLLDSIEKEGKSQKKTEQPKDYAV